MNKSRRHFIKQGSLLALAGLGGSLLSTNLMGSEIFDPSRLADPFSLPKLPYEYEALEPAIDKQTMEIHHTKHHQSYVNNLNKAIASYRETPSLDMIVMNISKYSDVIRNNAGGHWNHSFFWNIMHPGKSLPSGKIASAIDSAFGSFDSFKTKMEEAGTKRFGSGWAWLVLDENKKLSIGSTPNQDNPLMDISEFKGKPVLGIDVWEHAYYLKYQNKRGDYLKSFWNVVNWDEANRNLEKAEK